MLLIFLKMMPLVLMALIGYLLNRTRVISNDFNRQLSLTLINVFYPCMIVNLMVRNFTPAGLAECWVMPAGLVFILCTGWFLGFLTRGMLSKEHPATQRCYHFSCIMNNYSFLPIMMASSMWGDRAVALIIFSALGSELVIWTLGVKTLTGDKVSLKSLRHLCSMPMLALTLSFIIIFLKAALVHQNIHFAPPLREVSTQLMETCQFLSGATIPVSALICGSRMASIKADHLLTPRVAGTTLMRLVVIPAFCVGVLMLLPQ
jgi:malate permease and related proteins